MSAWTVFQFAEGTRSEEDRRSEKNVSWRRRERARDRLEFILGGAQQRGVPGGDSARARDLHRNPVGRREKTA